MAESSPRHAWKIAWSTKTQSAFGTALGGSDLTRFLRLTEPLTINANNEMWTDAGMVGHGHEWETQRGVNRSWVRLEIPAQPMPVDFAAMLIALLFSTEDYDLINTAAYQHVAKYLPLETQREQKVTSLAIYEDGVDKCIQDVCVQSLTIRGEAGSDSRVQLSASLLGSQLSTLESFSWPSSANSRYLYSLAGAYTRATVSKLAELRSFELNLEAGVSLDQAWRMVATEAARPYPSAWPVVPPRTWSLKTTHVCQALDLAGFRTAQQAGTEVATVITCLGADISGSDPTDTDSLSINVPKAVYDTMDYAWRDGRLHVDLTMSGHYDTTASLNAPLSVTTVEGSAGQLLVAAT